MRTVSSSLSPKNVRAPGRSGGGRGGEGGGDGGELRLTWNVLVLTDPERVPSGAGKVTIGSGSGPPFTRSIFTWLPLAQPSPHESVRVIV